MITNYLSLLKPTPQDYRVQTHPSSIPLSTDGTGDPAINKIRKYLSPHRAYTNSRETSKKQMSICHMVVKYCGEKGNRAKDARSVGNREGVCQNMWSPTEGHKSKT